MGTGGSSGVVIRLRIQRLEPLSGTAVTEDGSTVGFEAWMELIGAVAELLGPADHPCVENRNAPRGGEEPS